MTATAEKYLSNALLQISFKYLIQKLIITMHFNKKEYEKLFNYILTHSYDKPHVGKTVITTTLYFIDFNYYEAYGKSLTKETYQKHKINYFLFKK